MEWKSLARKPGTKCTRTSKRIRIPPASTRSPASAREAWTAFSKGNDSYILKLQGKLLVFTRMTTNFPRWWRRTGKDGLAGWDLEDLFSSGSPRGKLDWATRSRGWTGTTSATPKARNCRPKLLSATKNCMESPNSSKSNKSPQSSTHSAFDVLCLYIQNRFPFSWKDENSNFFSLLEKLLKVEKKTFFPSPLFRRAKRKDKRLWDQSEVLCIELIWKEMKRSKYR